MSEWWLISNVHGGIHRAPGSDAVTAKGSVREAIAECFRNEGLAPSAARRAASSYGVWVVAGPASYADVVAAYDAWDFDLAPAAALARATGHHVVAARLLKG